MKNRSKITLLLVAIFVAIGIGGCAAAGDAGSTTGAETLTQAQAEAIALEHAGLTAEQVTSLRTEKDWDDGAMEYEIEFRQGDYEFDYTVDAQTGQILSWDKERDPKTPPTDPTGPVTESTAPTESTNTTDLIAPSETTGPMLRSEAEAIALAHAGFTADQVTGLRAELDEDWEYEVEFRQGDYEYDYTIDAVNGEILDWDKERDSAPAETTAPSKPTEPAPSVPVDAPTAGKLTAAEAEAIALEHAGLTADQVTGLRTEMDWDDGAVEYEIEFRQGDYEFDYTVDAQTGQILSWDKERDPAPTETTAPTDPTETTGLIVPSETTGPMLRSEAEAIALNHAGFKADEVTGLRAELDEDWEYEVEFRQGDYEYDYTIDAVNGEILDWDKERDSAPAETTEPAPSVPVDAPTAGKLTAAEAEAIALAHAGVTDVTDLETEYDLDDGIPTYEVEFESGGWEYSYEIHGDTGEILSWEKDEE